MKTPNKGNSTGFILIWQTVLMYLVIPLQAIWYSFNAFFYYISSADNLSDFYGSDIFSRFSSLNFYVTIGSFTHTLNIAISVS